MSSCGCEFVKSAVFYKSLRKFEDIDFPQIVFAGRSNVGKSSLINALLCSRIARVSKTPGRTVAVNLFLINRCFCFVDLPGYGYAKQSKATRLTWSEVINAYLAGSDSIRVVYVLVDSRIEITAMDIQLMEWLRSRRVRFEVVFTKCDKKNAKALYTSQSIVSGDFSCSYHLVSVKKRHTLGGLCASVASYLQDVLT